MDPRPVFVLITAKTCPACHGFKNRIWNDLHNELVKRGQVQVVTIDVPTTQSKPDPTKYHKDLPRFIGWFPTMGLYPADKWYDQKSDLIGIVKNGKLVPPGKNEAGNFAPEHIEPVGNIDLSKEDVLKWVDYTLANDKIFTRNQVGSGNNTDNKTRLHNGKMIVPTSGYYTKFKPSKVE